MVGGLTCSTGVRESANSLAVLLTLFTIFCIPLAIITSGNQRTS